MSFFCTVFTVRKRSKWLLVENTIQAQVAALSNRCAAGRQIQQVPFGSSESRLHTNFSAPMCVDLSEFGIDLMY